MTSDAPAAGAATTRRGRAKSDRRSQILAAAERLMAERGYLAVRLEDIGAAAGVSGPAMFRHFTNREALLAGVVLGISTRLLAGARTVCDRADRDGWGPTETLDHRCDFHL